MIEELLQPERILDRHGFVQPHGLTDHRAYFGLNRLRQRAGGIAGRQFEHGEDDKADHDQGWNRQQHTAEKVLAHGSDLSTVSKTAVVVTEQGQCQLWRPIEGLTPSGKLSIAATEGLPFDGNRG